MKTLKILPVLYGVGLLLASCQTKEKEEVKAFSDPHSYADLEKAKISHLSWNVNADFDEQILSGVASYKFVNHGANQIIFDTEQLQIDSVVLENGRHADFILEEADQILGSPLKITIAPEDTTVHIYYKTSPEASALQWLNPVQTHDKKAPFLLSQGEAILTRSFIPIQDSPSVHITYDATVRVPKGLMALMSAENPTKKNVEGLYHFKMEQPIPPYLIALAIGDLEYKAIDHRTGVYAEPGMLEAAVWELADMGKMVDLAESLYGAYPWEQYDVLILPPSFPFGGMENPRLTFATPTIIVGDRSLTNLIAHELAHSWSGNLVTNATWNDFWLNEGFTVYFERRIMEALKGKEYADMISVIGYQDLEVSMNLIPEKFSSLYIDLEGYDPDEAFSDVPYDKGFLFLKMLEERYGRVKFDAFLKTYFKEHAFQTMDTERFVQYMKAHLTEGEDDFVQNWIYDTGWPKGVVKPTSQLFAKVEQEFEKDIQEISIEKTLSEKSRDWSTNEWIHYIRLIDQTQVTKEQMSKLDIMYDFTASKNPEIQCVWYEKAYLIGYEEAYDNAREFLIHVGRRKFLEPLYIALKDSDQLELAHSIYEEAKENYHFLANTTVEKLIEYQKGK